MNEPFIPPMQKLGPIMPEFKVNQKRKLKYAFAVGLYVYQKARYELKVQQANQEPQNESRCPIMRQMSSESSDFSRFASYMNAEKPENAQSDGLDLANSKRFVYSSAHLRDLNLLNQLK